MAPLLTQCPHCQTTFKVSPAQLEAAQGLVRCGACLGVFAARANVIRVKSANTRTRAGADKSATRDLDNTAGSPAPGNTIGQDAPASKASALPDAVKPAPQSRGSKITAPEVPGTQAPSPSLAQSLPSGKPPERQENFTGYLPAFDYRPGEFAADITDDPTLSARYRRLMANREQDDFDIQTAVNSHAASPHQDLGEDPEIAFGDMDLDKAPDAETQEETQQWTEEEHPPQVAAPDLHALLDEDLAQHGKPAADGYKKYLEYEDERPPATASPIPVGEGADPYLNRLPFVEVEQYEDDLQLDELLGEAAPVEADTLETADRDHSTRQIIGQDRQASDDAAEPPGLAALLGSQSVAVLDSDIPTTRARPPVSDFDFEEDLSPSFGDADLGEDSFSPGESDDFHSDAFHTEDQETEADAEPGDAADDEAETGYEPVIAGFAGANAYADEYEDEYDDDFGADEDEDEIGDEHEAEDDELYGADEALFNATGEPRFSQSTAEIRQRITVQPNTDAQPSKALLNRYVQNLEDDDALEGLPPETISMVDDEPVMITATAAPRTGMLTAGLAVLNLGLICVLALQFIHANLEQFNQSERFTLLRPYLCRILACPDQPKRSLPSTLYSQQLLVRMHPRISNALEVSFVFFNDSPLAQSFPGLELSFRDANDTLIASRLFTPTQYLPPELRTITEMPGNSSVQIQLDLVDPGPQALHYSIAFQEL